MKSDSNSNPQDCGCGCGGEKKATFRCFNRTHKNEKQLREAAPHLFSEDGEHGIPMNILRILHRLDHHSSLLTDHPAVASFLRTNKLSVPKFTATRNGAPLFSGTIFFAQVSFTVASTLPALKVGDDDMKMMVRYATLAQTPISSYCAQYGPNQWSVSPQILTYSVNISSASIGNSQLAGWVNDLKQINSLPEDSAIFIPVPNGISGKDIGENSGYHDMADIPWIVAGTWSNTSPPQPFQLSDAEDCYAMVVSHEIAELIVDPKVDHANPEVCDPCDLNCQNLFRLYFDAANNYLGSNNNSPPGGFTYAYYICAIVKPDGAGNCPASGADCQYQPWARSLQFSMGKSSFSKDDITNATSYPTAFWIQVQGFTNESLNLTKASDLQKAPNPPITMTPSFDESLNAPNNLTVAQINTINGNLPSVVFGPAPILPTDASFQSDPQVFLVPYTINFGSANAVNALNPDQSAFITIDASLTVGTVTISARANIVISAGENPRFENLNPNNPTSFPSWLSFDLRFIKVTVPSTANRFGAVMSSNPTDAPGFIASVIQNLTAGGGTVGVESFDNLTQDEEKSALEFLPKDKNGNAVFNFAIARVRLLGNIAGAVAKSVRVFFRLMNAQTTASNSNTATAYRFYSDGALNGTKLPLLGVQDGEYVTAPCFATPRINFNANTNTYVPVNMSSQTDPPNVHDINVNPGTEVDTFFGCWLDLNQPAQKWLPASVPAANIDGPFGGSLLSLSEAFVKAPHQCLIAEIRCDDTPIPPGADTSNSDKLAQRNIAWIDGPNPGEFDSRRMPHPFDVLASPINAVQPDVLVISWDNTPRGSVGDLYLPGISASDIVALAAALYDPFAALSVVDEHTLGCPAEPGSVTLVPLPPGSVRFAGLLTVDLPAGIKAGQHYNISIQQTTMKKAMTVPPPDPPKLALSLSSSEESITYYWRQATGAFQISIVVSHKEALLFPEQRLLSWLRWKLTVVPATSRWYPVLQRYEQQVSGRVSGFGGDPGQVKGSPDGDPTGCGSGGHGHHGCHCHDHCGKGRGDHCKCRTFMGKVCQLAFDAHGDLVGFGLRLSPRRSKHRWWCLKESEHTAADDVEVEVKDDDEKCKEMHFCVRPGCRVKELLEGCKSSGRTLNVCVNRDGEECVPIAYEIE
jgi:hypothetical protein